MHFTRAIVRTPGRSLAHGLTTRELGTPDYDLALAQHAAYVAALESCGLDVTVLPADEAYPDSVFVEDTALLTPHAAFIMRPGAESRRGETQSIRAALEDHYDFIDEIKPPGTVDAGDVMMVSSHFYIGLSSRTNQSGAEQLIGLLRTQHLTGGTVPLTESLHLKSSAAYIENNVLVVAGEMRDCPQFDGFDRIEVSAGEAYAANCLWINGTVLVAAGFAGTAGAIRAKGYQTLELEMSEFQKVDGGLSCLSLRF